MLHFAPESPIKKRIIKNFRGEYFGSDIVKGRADYVVDMTDICFEDNFFDYIIACNVMEHIAEEKKALEELKRVIKPDGVIILSFPVAFDRADTYGDSGLSGEERIRHFGQEDHVRIYGMDHTERFKKYGFEVRSFLPKDVMKNNEIKQNGFGKVSPILILRKL